RHTRSDRDWSSDVCSSDLAHALPNGRLRRFRRLRRVRLRRGTWFPKDPPTAPDPFVATHSELAMFKGLTALVTGSTSGIGLGIRSEERRVGKEGRCRRWPS